jgi:hypothetical protein
MFKYMAFFVWSLVCFVAGALGALAAITAEEEAMFND